MTSRPVQFLLILFVCLGSLARGDAPPRTVGELWSDFDPRLDDLDVHIVREWQSDGIVYRYVTFHVGTFLDRPARIAAFYGFPVGAQQLPGLLHLHGGGQRAFLDEVDFYARRGYACLSINWGGREMETAEAGDPNTDWGVVDPTQQNVPGYFNLRPGERYLDPMDSPRNNNWYLLTLAARRGLTFLERQPEVDPDRLGVYGHSMGGNLTVYVAGCDHRVKVAAPSVGGSGFRTQAWPLLPEQRKQTPNGDVELFNATLGFESYAPRIEAPLIWLGATNDFHGILDDTYLTSAPIPHDQVRYAFTPHMNHRFTPAFAVARPLWLDQHLKGTFTFPQTPGSALILDTESHIPKFEVTPDPSLPIEQVQLLYSVDPDPQARFWRTADATRQGNVWTADLPILSTDQPLFALANVHYRLSRPETAPHAPPTMQFALTSLLQTAPPDELRLSAVVATDAPSPVIDDFARGWKDWYTLSPDNPHHWEYSTRKLNDPKWRGRPGDTLMLELRAEQSNELVIILTENFFRPYRGPSRENIAVAKLSGGQKETLALLPADFQTAAGEPLSSWDQIDLLSLRAYHKTEGRTLGSTNWAGPQPQFLKLYWERR